MRIEQNKKLISNARSLRKNMTKEERRLWYSFLCRCPAKFRRQQVIGNYIVDFYCHEKKLVVELDGSQHFEENGKQADAVRDAYMRSLGMTVLRYSNLDINRRFEGVCEDILQYLDIGEYAMI